MENNININIRLVEGLEVQENIRQQAKQYIVENGIKQNFIARKLEISDAMMSYYLNDKKNLSYEKELQLQKIIRC